MLSNWSKWAQDIWLLWLLQLPVDGGRAKQAAVKITVIQEERQGGRMMLQKCGRSLASSTGWHPDPQRASVMIL